MANSIFIRVVIKATGITTSDGIIHVLGISASTLIDSHIAAAEAILGQIVVCHLITSVTVAGSCVGIITICTGNGYAITILAVFTVMEREVILVSMPSPCAVDIGILRDLLIAGIERMRVAIYAGTSGFLILFLHRNLNPLHAAGIAYPGISSAGVAVCIDTMLTLLVPRTIAVIADVSLLATSARTDFHIAFVAEALYAVGDIRVAVMISIPLRLIVTIRTGFLNTNTVCAAFAQQLVFVAVVVRFGTAANIHIL